METTPVPVLWIVTVCAVALSPLKSYFLAVPVFPPVIVTGALLSMVMVFCNYVNVEWMIIGFMALAFFGKGIGALGWAVMADTAPKEISGLSGGLFNMFGNISGIVTPIAIGYIVGTTGSFNGALIYVGVHALIAVLSYLVLVGDIKRIELKPVAGQ